MKVKCSNCKFRVDHFRGKINIGMCKKTKILNKKTLEFHMFDCINTRKFKYYCGPKGSWYKKL